MNKLKLIRWTLTAIAIYLYVFISNPAAPIQITAPLAVLVALIIELHRNDNGKNGF